MWVPKFLRRWLPERRFRLRLEVSPAVRARIEALVEVSGAGSTVEVLRRALAAYDAVVQTEAEGGRVWLRDQHGNLRPLEVIGVDEPSPGPIRRGAHLSLVVDNDEDPPSG